ncbi:Mu transposase C-terminal domain-containing protein [Lichenibacterium dinghuense]|uniref:Mu transposase C-terminal domain-containing protein n=1 Tax=Lichenibacterium dinghuense TaxID=2895977 RepID=UPI001F411115|nr:Mu transposase C-terminal domain-containing protein [Lichenibacterium sp. 6Y81]
MIVTPFRLTAHDRLTIKGVAYDWNRSEGDGHVLTRADDPKRHAFFSHRDLFLARMDEGFRFERDFYAPAKVAAAAVGASRAMHELSPDEQASVFHKLAFCTAFLMAEERGEVSRSDEGMDAAVELIAPGAEAFLKRKLKTPGSEHRKGYTSGKRILRERPSGRTLRRWLSRLVAGSYCPTSLQRRKSVSGVGRASRISDAIEDLMAKCARRYASEMRPTVVHCHKLLDRSVRLLNAHLERHERPTAGPTPAVSTFARRIARIGAFAIHAGRFGEESAKTYFAMLGSGMGILRPGERVEIDHCELPVMVLVRHFVEAGILDEGEGEAERFKAVKLWMCVAVDVATRYVLGLVLTKTPTAASACATLEMVVSDKTRFARDAGAVTDWSGACTPELIAHDSGSEFIADAFQAKGHGLRSSMMATMAARPQQRGHGERLNLIAAQEFAVMFTGRTFANPVEKGKYKSAARAAVVEDEFADLVALWFADVYHNTPHAGLGMETPLNAWLTRTAEFGVAPPPGPDIRRHVFGTEVTRKTGRHGVRVLNLDYACERLHEHRRQVGEGRIEVRVDPMEVGSVSVKLGDLWWPARCRMEGFDGVTVAEWLATARELRETNKRNAELSAQVVLDALHRIRKTVKQGILRMGLGSDRLTAEELNRAEAGLRIGFCLPRAPGIGEDEPDPDLMANAIRGGVVPAPGERASGLAEIEDALADTADGRDAHDDYDHGAPRGPSRYEIEED